MNSIEYALRDWIGYGWALASFETATILILATLLFFGIEHKGRLVRGGNGRVRAVIVRTGGRRSD